MIDYGQERRDVLTVYSCFACAIFSNNYVHRKSDYETDKFERKELLALIYNSIKLIVVYLSQQANPVSEKYENTSITRINQQSTVCTRNSIISCKPQVI